MNLPIELMPAAGWCKTVEQVGMLAKVPVIERIIMGSFTVAHRDGNTDGTNFIVLKDGTSFNALGLPNGGFAYLKLHLREMVQIARDAGKLSVVNVAGDTPEEYLLLAEFAHSCGADDVEYNFGCPNKFAEGGTQSEIASYSIDLMEKTVALLGAELRSTAAWFKFSPYANPEERVRVAAWIASIKSLAVVRLTLCNTYPNCVPRDEKGKLLITAKNTNGRAGMAGYGFRHIARANAEHFRALLPEKMMNYAGGISSGAHLVAAYRMGCTGAQIGTAFFNGDNFRIFEEIAADFLEICEAA